MLVLTRLQGESIVLVVPPSKEPTTIVVTAVDLRGNKCRLGTSAPERVEVDRQEVYEAKQRIAAREAKQ